MLIQICDHCIFIVILCMWFLALNAQVTVVDRPVTQQGLGGMKTAARGLSNCFSLIRKFYSI